MMLYQQINRLFSEQTACWELACRNIAELKNVKIRNFDFGNFSIRVQFNPARIRSVAAGTDEKSIAERACFLCKQNRPQEQKSVLWGDYEILVNPYPIFTKHFTVVSKNHISQQIKPFFADMLRLASEMPGYAVFYNGARCGASAPDHLHFQTVPEQCLPVITDYRRLKATYAKIVQDAFNFKIYELKNYLRKVFCIEIPISIEPEVVRQIFFNFFEKINFADETMINIVCTCENDKYFVFVFPRKAFRPWQYFIDNEAESLLISPAAVELSGVIITPKESDFYKITKEDIAGIYEQIS